MLIGARFVQGIGGAMTSAVILGMIVTMFPEPREQAKAIGVYSFVASAGASIGLLAGGVLTQAHQLALDLLRQPPDRRRRRACWRVRLLEPDDAASACARAPTSPGAALVTGALMLGVYTIVGTVDHGWGSAHTLGFGAVAVALLAGFVARQATASTAAGAAAHLPLAQRLGRERRPGADGRRACSGCSSSARSTCSACSATTPSQTGAGLPARVASASACSRSASRRG